MAVSTIDFLREKKRQVSAQDSNFLKRMLYFFELRIPASLQTANDNSGFLFPLILPPESYDMEEPFTVESTGTLDGGLYTEENGIVSRTIKIKGHTGFKPRMLKTSSGSNSSVPNVSMLSAKHKSYSRTTSVEPLLYAISGQKHFQYLQDSVFRTYADLKRDPATAEETVLIFHNPRDDEHWVVKPMRFSLNRNNQTRVLYHYDIELLVVGPAESVDADFSEDKSVLDQLKDALRTAQRAVDMVTGAVNDLTALQGELTSYVHSIASIIRSVNSILDATSDFIDGTTTLIQAPYSSLGAAIEGVEAATNLIASQKELNSTFQTIPEHTIQKFRQLKDGLELLGTSPASWETPTEATIRKLRDRQDTNRLISGTRRDEALANTPTSLNSVRSLGTNMTSGDVTTADGNPVNSSPLRKYRSMREITVEQDDTLASLASRYLGDARLWQHIAVANGLKPPYIDSQANSPLVGSVSLGSQRSGSVTGADGLPFGAVVGVGSKINVPTNSASSLDLPLLPVMGVRVEESAENQFLGTDFKLVRVNNPANTDKTLYDFAVNTELGGTDIQTVQGIDNLVQVVTTRLTTDQGSDILYRKLGVKRLVGLGFTLVDIENAKFSIREAIVSDPRIANISDINYEQEADSFVVDMRAQIRGFGKVRPLRTTL